MQDFEGILTFCDLNRLSREAWQIESAHLGIYQFCELTIFFDSSCFFQARLILSSARSLRIVAHHAVAPISTASCEGAKVIRWPYSTRRRLL